MVQARFRSVLWLVVGSFVWTAACGSGDDDDGTGGDTTSTNTSTVGFGGAGSTTANAATGTTANTANTANNNNNNASSSTDGDVLMHDDSACLDQDPADGEDCDDQGLVCIADDGTQCVCGELGPEGEWNCIDFGGTGQAGAGGEGGAG